MGFAKAHIQIPLEEKVVVALGYGSSPKLGVHFIIYTMTEASDFKFGTQLGFVIIKSHPEEKCSWPWVREAPIYLGFPFNIFATDALSS